LSYRPLFRYSLAISGLELRAVIGARCARARD
jgi:hypothetical protein